MSNYIVSRQPHSGKAFKQQELLQSESCGVREVYQDLLTRDDNFQPSERTDDVVSKFNAAFARLPLTAAQRLALRELQREMSRIEESIDPARLNFTIDQSPDDDIVLHHSHPAGVSSLVIHEDGLVAFSFIARREVNKQDELTFHEAPGIDWEGLSLHFLVGQGT